MRLLDTATLGFVEFFQVDQINHPYWILSHRWEDQETSLQQWETEKHLSPGQCRRGTVKIKEFCTLAARKGIQLAWVDTCCIDKTSSAELTEAINSMCNWYRCSARCIVYLSDVRESLMNVDEDNFKKSIWFTRGWTLQELLAPRDHHFYDSDWAFIGSRESLTEKIADATSINSKFYGGHDQIWSASVAQRMSWVGKRETTRSEDLAYCMLGIFNVNMPLIYGEGDQAFHRLQIEILRRSPDETIFAWRAPLVISGLLADHPRMFGDTQKLGIVRSNTLVRPPSSVTSRGVHFHVARTFEDKRGHYWITLDCRFGSDGTYLGICLANIDNEWYRIHCFHLASMSAPESSYEDIVARRFKQMQQRLVKGEKAIWARNYINPIYINQYEMPSQEDAKRRLASCLNCEKDENVALWAEKWHMKIDDSCFDV